MNDNKGLGHLPLISAACLEELSAVVGQPNLRSEPGDLKHYGKDWLKDFEPNPALIVFPGNADEVAGVLKVASKYNLAVVPSGGRTGLSGGATATMGELILSFERMNRIIAVNSLDRTMQCEAGVVTQRIQEEAERHGFYFPVDFASKGSSQIGGNVATNAGGIRVIRYGNIREWVLGLKVVTAAGEILELNGSLFKNQAGFDLKSLIIGSEGTLAVIVEVTLKLTSQPGDLIRVLCATEQVEQIPELLRIVREKYPNVSAFEYFMGNGLEKVLRLHGLRDPFSKRYSNYAIIEFERTNRELAERIEEDFSELLERELLQDVVIGQNARQSQELMRLRELISETLSTLHTVHKNDISVPISSIPAWIKETQEEVATRYSGFEIVIFGHIGDGNLHLNILKPEPMSNGDFFAFCEEADHHIFRLVQKYKGSISAEHGVGLLKKPFLGYTRSEIEIEYMRRIKAAMDPKGILNPGKIFDVSRA